MENKKYFCSELNNVLTCMNQDIVSCCSGRVGPAYFNHYNGEKFSKSYLLEIKEKYFNLLNDNDIESTPCKNCFYLREMKPVDKISETFNLINISHWTQCNCGCIYCARIYESKGEITKRKKKSKYYDFLPLLKQLYKENLLDKENLTVCFQGGDISVLKEFEPTVKEFLKNGVKNFQILSNNITYQPIIKKLLDKNMLYYNTSLDCGTRETYYKIKRVDKFNDFVKNLKKYAHTEFINNIGVKYILLHNINDNREEIDKFIGLMSDIGIKNIEFMLDFKVLFCKDFTKHPIPANYRDIYLYFKNACLEHGMRFGVWPMAEEFIKTHLL